MQYVVSPSLTLAYCESSPLLPSGHSADRPLDATSKTAFGSLQSLGAESPLNAVVSVKHCPTERLVLRWSTEAPEPGRPDRPTALSTVPPRINPPITSSTVPVRPWGDLSGIGAGYGGAP